MNNTEKKTRRSPGEFKEIFLSIVQKTVVIIIACLMLLGVLPIGLMPDSDTAKYSGEYLRLFPESEVYSVSDSESGTAGIGVGGSAYLKFSLDRLRELNAEDIKSVQLRLAFLNGSGAVSGDVAVSLLPYGVELTDNMELGFPVLSERRIEALRPQTGGAGDSLSQVDLTGQAKKLIKQGRTELAVRLSGESSVRAVLAGGSYADPAYRPCLSVVTGTAEDEASGSLDKAVLTDATYVTKNDSSAKGGELSPLGDFLIVDESRETYLRFELDEKAMLGSVYKAVLSLGRIGIGSEAGADRIRIYCINNDEWTSSDISYDNRPRGDENTASSVFAGAKRHSGRINFDVSQTVCEAISKGIKTLTFRITGLKDGESIYLSGAKNSADAPKLYIKATDDKYISAAAEAALYALGDNRQSFVTMKLETEYRAEDGTEARIRWKEYNEDAEEITDRHIRENGEVIRPKWFEGNAYTLAVARIRSGGYETEREYRLNIPSAAVPDYSRYKFGNYIDIGNSRSEDKQKFDSVNFSGSRWQWADGRVFSYRVPEEDGTAVLNLSCEPGSENYLTLKLWEGDDAKRQGFAVGTVDTEPVILEAPPDSIEHKGGFIYATYALPRGFTEGRSFVSLRLSFTEDKAEDTEPRGIYAAYMTQSPYFEPKLFASQGEKAVSEPFFGEGAIQSFIENLRSGDTPLNFTDGEPGEGAEEEPEQSLSVDGESGSVVAAGNEANIAFSINEELGTADIYQRLEYYDRYSSRVPVISDSGVISVNYGDYKLIWNRNGSKGAKVPAGQLEMTGEYKDITRDIYYNFSDDWQTEGESIIPEGAERYSGAELTVMPGELVLLMHIADPPGDSDWRVTAVNGREAASLSLENGEQLNAVTVKAVGDIYEGAESVCVMLCTYRNGRLMSMSRGEADLSQSMNIYTVDFSDSGVYMNKGYELRIFVYDDTADMTRLMPRLEVI